MSTSSNNLDAPEKQGGWRPDWETRFKPGVSGNPGGVPRGAVFVSDCYKRLISLPLADLKRYKPKNGAEAIALKQALNAVSGKALNALPSAREIVDRTEGKAPQRVDLAAEVNILQVQVLIEVAGELAAKHGLTVEAAKERLLQLRPELRELAEP